MEKQANQHRATWRVWTAAGAAAGLSAIAAAVMALHGGRAEATANSAPLVAPALPIAMLATGTPAGICTMESSESSPLSALL